MWQAFLGEGTCLTPPPILARQASLVTTLAAAKRVGAFELPGRVVQSPSDLDKLLVRLNAEGRGGPMASSEVSTDVGSDSPAPR